MQKEYTIKPEQDSKVEKTTLTAALNRKRKEKTQNLHNTLQLNTMEKKYNSNKNNNGSVSQGPGSLKGQPY